MSTVLRRATVIALLAAAGCHHPPAHRLTDVVATKPSPDGGLVAALVWDEHGVGGPHVSGIVVVPRGGDPLDGDPVLLEAEDYRPLEFGWTGRDALSIRLPCGWWYGLTNHWARRGTGRGAGRVVDIDFRPPQGCLAAHRATGATALPADASQPAMIEVSPH